jgi:hypothetical protein
VDIAYGADAWEYCPSSGVRQKWKGRMSAAWSSLRMFSFRDDSSSSENASALAMSGITLVRCERRRRYSISTGLTPTNIRQKIDPQKTKLTLQNHI